MNQKVSPEKQNPYLNRSPYSREEIDSENKEKKTYSIAGVIMLRNYRMKKEEK